MPSKSPQNNDDVVPPRSPSEAATPAAGAFKAALEQELEGARWDDYKAHLRAHMIFTRRWPLVKRHISDTEIEVTVLAAAGFGYRDGETVDLFPHGGRLRTAKVARAHEPEDGTQRLELTDLHDEPWLGWRRRQVRAWIYDARRWLAERIEP